VSEGEEEAGNRLLITALSRNQKAGKKGAFRGSQLEDVLRYRMLLEFASEHREKKGKRSQGVRRHRKGSPPAICRLYYYLDQQQKKGGGMR